MPENPPETAGAAVVVKQQPTGGGSITTIAGGLFDAFKTSPVLLLIVLLNMAFAGVGGYYLLKVEEYRAADREKLVDLLGKCITDTVPISYLANKPAGLLGPAR